MSGIFKKFIHILKLFYNLRLSSKSNEENFIIQRWIEQGCASDSVRAFFKQLPSFSVPVSNEEIMKGLLLIDHLQVRLPHTPVEKQEALRKLRWDYRRFAFVFVLAVLPVAAVPYWQFAGTPAAILGTVIIRVLSAALTSLHLELVYEITFFGRVKRRLRFGDNLRVATWPIEIVAYFCFGFIALFFFWPTVYYLDMGYIYLFFFNFIVVSIEVLGLAWEVLRFESLVTSIRMKM